MSGAEPVAGDWVIWRDWGLNVREIAQVTPRLFKLERGGHPRQIERAKAIAILSERDDALKLRDAIAGADGEYERRRLAADIDRNARVKAAADARDATVAKLVANLNKVLGK